MKQAENSWEPIQVIMQGAPKLLEAFQKQQQQQLASVPLDSKPVPKRERT